MEGRVIGPGPYRATKLWNETIQLFRGGMPLRRHWMHLRYYDCTFSGSEAVDYLHQLLRHNCNFGPEVTRNQTLQLLRKFLKAHVIEDIKGRHGTEDFEDNCHLYRHSVAIGDVHECKLIRRKDITPKEVDHIWKSMTAAHLQQVLGLTTLDGILNPAHVKGKYIVHNVFNINKSGIVVLENNDDDMPYWVISAMKCLAKWPNGNDTKQPVYPGFERDVLKTVADYYQRLKEPLLTFHLYEVFVNILSLLQEQDLATEALQVSTLLLSPPNRRHLQLLLRLMARVSQNPHLPPLNDTIATRTLVVQMFSQCVLGSPDEMDLDELLASKLVTFMMEHHHTIFQVPDKLRCQVEEHLSHLRRVQIKYAGSDTDFSTSPAFHKQIRRVVSEEPKVIGTQTPLQELLEGLISDKELPAKDKKKRLKQFQKSYPEIYRNRFPSEESRAAVMPEKNPRLKPHLLFFNLKKPSNPFQRSWSFRA
uniref:DEP domain containing 1B n=1 Tax=Hippocampus comes TaxID=109280 RepID=A0A3Q2YUH8_HIPCM